MRRVLYAVVVVAVALVVYYCFWSGGPTPQQEAAINRAYLACAEEVDKSADELETWYMSYTKGPTEKAADELVGWKAKWITLTGTEKERRAHAREVMRKYLFTEDSVKKQVARRVAAVMVEWRDIENNLAIETGCMSLSSKAKAEKIQGKEAAGPPPEVLRNEVLNTVYREVASLVGGEVLTVIATDLATSTGILSAGLAAGWETFGIGLAAGVLVDVIFGWFTDPEGKIQAQLDDRIRKTATQQKKVFREVMMKALNARRDEWINQM